ncbi:MAG: hypothetical protein IPK99_13115 [Flavobacteriales bacterium]|nr:hypothetical protein [Flavobacteriales bacterium]
MGTGSVTTIIGIDFGARSSGNTVVCEERTGRFVFHRTAKGEDGDAWLEETVSAIAPSIIFIDAPLSLPGVYHGKGTDYFFRLADHQSGGMSPMFLGGLTARAMRLAATWQGKGIGVHEVYPAALIRHAWAHLGILPGKPIPKPKLRIMAGMFMLPPPEPADRHEADAWLCWLIGHKHRSRQAKVYGKKDEGLILA